MDLNRMPDDGGSSGGTGSNAGVICSVCLETVSRDEERTVVELKCLHQFHLDCIGSAFNAKGGMECPNCREVEVGDWKFANGVSNASFLADNWNYEDDEYEELIGHSHFPHMAVTFQWCPYNLEHIPTPFSEGNHFSNSYTQVHQWNGPTVPAEVQIHASPAYGFSGADAQYHGWEQHTLPLYVTPGGHVTGVEQNSLSSNANANVFPVQHGSNVHPFYQPSLSSHQQRYYEQQPYNLPLHSHHQASTISDPSRPVSRSGLNIIPVNQGGSYFTPSSMGTMPLQNLFETAFPASTEPLLVDGWETGMPGRHLSSANFRLNRNNHSGRAWHGHQTTTTTTPRQRNHLP